MSARISKIIVEWYSERKNVIVATVTEGKTDVDTIEIPIDKRVQINLVDPVIVEALQSRLEDWSCNHAAA